MLKDEELVKEWLPRNQCGHSIKEVQIKAVTCPKCLAGLLGQVRAEALLTQAEANLRLLAEARLEARLAALEEVVQLAERHNEYPNHSLAAEIIVAEIRALEALAGRETK